MHPVTQRRKGGNEPLKSFDGCSSAKCQHQIRIEGDAIGLQRCAHERLVLQDKGGVIHEDARSVRRELSRRQPEVRLEVRGKRRANVGKRYPRTGL